MALEKISQYPHSMGSSGDGDKMKQLFEEHQVPIELREIVKTFLLKPLPTRNTKDHTENPSFRCTPELLRLTKSILAEMPPELGLFMSDLYRAGMLSISWQMTHFIKDVKLRANYLAKLKELSEIEDLLSQKSITEKLAGLRADIIKADFSPEELTIALKKIANIKKDTKGSLE